MLSWKGMWWFFSKKPSIVFSFRFMNISCVWQIERGYDFVSLVSSLINEWILSRPYGERKMCVYIYIHRGREREIETIGRGSCGREKRQDPWDEPRGKLFFSSSQNPFADCILAHGACHKQTPSTWILLLSFILYALFINFYI